MKDDGGKLRWMLIPWKMMKGVVRAFMNGATKYADNDWKNVKGGYVTYMNAAFRHMIDRACGEEIDPDSGNDPIDHAIASLLIAKWHWDKNIKKGK